METHFNHTLFDRRQIIKPRNSAVKWSKQWVPQEVVATGGKRLVLKWVNEATLNAMKHKPYEPSVVGTEPEPTTEVLFLCSYEGCGKTFFDASALKKHSHIHGERQYICHYENCGKKFLDSSKLKRHFLSHTGERHFVCPHEGCGKAFSLDFNLRSHMKTHSQENYHICPYPECGKRFAHGYKLRNHIGAHHDKLVQNIITDAPKYHTPPPEKPAKVLKPSAGPSGPASSERPFACPYEGCEKAYIHEYKLNLHLKREHPGHLPDEKAKKAEPNNDGTDLDAYGGKHKAQKQNKRKLNSNLKVPPSKAPQRKSGNNGSSAFNLNVVKKTWPPCKEDIYEDEDSEETEEERENVREGWTNGQNNNDDDDEETEYED